MKKGKLNDDILRKLLAPQNNETITRVRYQVRDERNSIFHETGYSKYWKLFSQAADPRRKRKSVKRPVYGPAQAREHIAELRKYRYHGELIHKDAVFQIIKVTTVEEVIATHKP